MRVLVSCSAARQHRAEVARQRQGSKPARNSTIRRLSHYNMIVGWPLKLLLGCGLALRVISSLHSFSCDESPLVGQRYGQHIAVLDEQQSIRVYRNGKELLSGDGYLPGEELEVVFDVGFSKAEHILISNKAIFQSVSHCHGLRSFSSTNRILTPSSITSELRLYAAWRESEDDSIKITRMITLHHVAQAEPKFLSKPEIHLQDLIPSYTHTCTIVSGMTLSWSASSNGINGSVSYSSSTNWLSLGVVQPYLSMVPTNTFHSVYLFAPSVNKTGRFQLQGYSADSIVPDTRPRNRSRLETAVTIGGSSYIVFEYLNGQEFSDDADVVSTGGNYVIYAHGADWPNIHTEYGFLLIDWSAGTCSVTESTFVSPFFVFLPILFIVVLMKTPLKQLSVFRYLLLHRMPYFNDFSIAGGILIVIHYIICFIVLGTNVNAYGASDFGYASATGMVTMMNLWVALLPSSKTTVLNFFTEVPFERSIKYHKLLTATAMFFAYVHAIIVTQFYNYENVDHLNVIPDYGQGAIFIFSVMTFFAIEPIRRAFYELFLYIHYLFPFGILFAALHVKDSWAAIGFIPGKILFHRYVQFHL